ncbi:MAG: bifunctional 23S rRNA (guanine(2069)-N(7))-methyltransferase RlmK/23S rRNA (guanine(2445)-N(2))-methyltransferase RlmL, partial [Gammaproteobacteria bacterium]|nr:bifunctional 23S rRNA (guanine(2069)-N(7))-methyltransferase RlmK/23S rRNA (guanine(2445)-N(2))-methyltransferase RlmL [Gammaproteobacteria bacterium]
MSSINYFFATCSKGVEDLLQKELEQLDAPQIKIHTGGVSFGGEFEHAYKACLWSRVASRILFQLKAFEISSDDDLYDEIIDIDWSTHFSESNTLAIDCFSSHSVVTNSHYATLRIKDAIVDQFTQRIDDRPSISKDNPDIRINVYLSDKQCLLYLDMSGEALHKRGYRQDVGSAPLRETLAAAMLYRARWNTFYEKGMPLIDPMCGSGTLLIEAAMMASNFAPGLMRDKFGFTSWKQFDQQLWEIVRRDAEEKYEQSKASLPIICGSDNNEILVGIARKNITEAGFSSAIKVSLQDATDNLLPCSDAATGGKQGLLITNPPYGKRIGQVQLLRTLYYRFGIQLKSHFNGWIAVVFTSEQALAQSIGMRAFRKNTLFTGALKSVLYQYRIDPVKPQRLEDDKQDTESSNTTDEVSTGSAKSEHALMFANRLKKNYKHLKKWARKNNITCYRVYDADIPQYAVAIDKYDNWIHVQEYKAPKT